MKAKAPCFIKKTLLKHIKTELDTMTHKHRQIALQGGGLNFPFLLFKVRNLFGFPKEEELAFINEYVQKMMEEKTLFQALDERNVIHILTNFSDIKPLSQDNDKEKYIANYLKMFRQYASKDVRKAIVSMFQGGDTRNSRPTGLTSQDVQALCDLFSIRKTRNTLISKSSITSRAIRINHQSLGLVLDMLFVDPNSEEDLMWTKELISKSGSDYHKIYFAFPNELANIDDSRAKNRKMLNPNGVGSEGPFVQKLDDDSWIYKLTSSSSSPVTELLHNYKHVEVDYSRSMIRLDGKISVPLSLVFHSTQFSESFDYRFIGQQPQKQLLDFSRSISLNQMREVLEWSKNLTLLKLGYFAHESECRYSKVFSCSGQQVSSPGQMLVDTNFCRDSFFVKYLTELSNLYKDAKTEKVAFVDRKPFLVIANKQEIYQYLKTASSPVSFVYDNRSLIKDDPDLPTKIPMMHAVFEIPLNSDSSSEKIINIETFDAEYQKLSDEIKNRWLLGQGFSRQEASNCFVLRQILGEEFSGH